MIKWTDEQLQGEPIYNILGTPSLNGVQFKLANAITQQGTPFSAQNMAATVQKSQAARYFYYNGASTLTTSFPAADNGLAQGIFLAKLYAGMELAAEGTVYLVAGGHAQRVENPRGWSVVRDGALYCQLGEEVVGMIKGVLR